MILEADLKLNDQAADARASSKHELMMTKCVITYKRDCIAEEIYMLGLIKKYGKKKAYHRSARRDQENE